MLTTYHCYNPACGHGSTLGAFARGHEVLCGVIFRTGGQGILCRGCTERQVDQGTVKSWQPLTRFLKIQKSLEVFIQQQVAARDEQRQRDHQRRQARARKQTRQSAWRGRLQPIAA